MDSLITENKVHVVAILAVYHYFRWKRCLLVYTKCLCNFSI